MSCEWAQPVAVTKKFAFSIMPLQSMVVRKNVGLTIIHVSHSLTCNTYHFCHITPAIRFTCKRRLLIGVKMHRVCCHIKGILNVTVKARL